MASPGLSMESTGETAIANGRLPVFDILRGCAAILVFLFHYGGFVAPYTNGAAVLDAVEWLTARLGSIGTNLLLLLSGYFLAHSIAGGKFSYPRFVWLRLVRIYVPYLAVLTLAVLFSGLMPQYAHFAQGTLTWRVILEQALLLPGLFPERPILTVTWTLSYIVAGYITLPLIGFALRRHQVTANHRQLLWAGLVLLNLFAGLSLGFPPARFAYIPAGYLVFELQRAEWLPPNRPGLLRGATALAAAAMIYRSLLDSRLIGASWPGVPAQLTFVVSGLIVVNTLVFAGLTLQRRHHAHSTKRLPRYLAAYGRTGYSFYLVHGPVVKLFALLVFPALAGHTVPAPVFWLVMPLCFAAAAGAAGLLYLFVERPCRRWVMGH